MSHTTMEFGGQTLRLLPEKAIFHEASSTLLVADMHLGKEFSFQSRGIPVPQLYSEYDLSIIEKLNKAWGFERVIVLGDLIHDEFSLPKAFVQKIGCWLDAKNFEVVLVAGNHDRHLKKINPQWRLSVRSLGDLSGIHLVHDQPAADFEGYSIGGHLHPVFELKNRVERLIFPCFWLKGRHLTLPSFGSLTGGEKIRPSGKDGVWIVHNGKTQLIN